MTTILTFRNYTFSPVTHQGKIWLTSAQIAKALEYAREDAVTKIYNRNSDEFNSDMTVTPNLGVTGKSTSYDNLQNEVRIFSLRGAHLIAMFARTPVAKEFRKWVLDILDKEVGNPQYKPEAPELFSHSDTRNLARLVWSISGGFQFKQSWSNAVWFALRNVTGTPSPQHFEVQQIPLIAQECRRIYYVTSQLQHITHEAEKQTIKRLLRKREDADRVLAEMKQLFSERQHRQQGAITGKLEYWQENEINQFLHRN